MNWKQGDRALCIDGSPGEMASLPEEKRCGWVDDGFNVAKGVIYIVHRAFVTPGDWVFLAVRDCEARQEQGWSAARFRKIVPACDRVTEEANYL